MVRCLNCMELYEEQYEVCSHCGYVRGTPPKEAYHLYPGMVLAGRYTIGTVLGFGGFGVTYRAWDQVLERMVAVKEYYPNGIVNRIPGQSEVIVYTGNRADEFQKGKERFLSEARNMAKFNTHPNIVNVYAFFEENNTAYIVMEFLDGISFKQYIAANGGRVEIQVAVEVVLSVLDALKEIHNARIIHRDISPDNIFICQGGTIKVIDFGAARFSTGEEEKTLSIILKPGYAPPEQYRGKSRQGPWTDIYAVGAVLYRALTGVTPEESVNRMVEDNLKAPHELNSSIPIPLNNCVMRAMALNQELRFQNVDQFRAALQNKARVQDVDSVLKRRKKLRVVSIALICAVILAAGSVCFSIYRSRSEKASLSKATIEIWIPAGEQGAGKSRFGEMLTEFEAAYSKVTVEIKEIPAAEYKASLVKAIEAEDMPDLFDSSCLGEEYRDSFASLQEVHDLLKTGETAGDYDVLEQYKAGDPEFKQMPLSFQVPVIYVNTNLSQIEKIQGPEQLTENGEAVYGLNESEREIYEELYGVELSGGGYEEFQNKKVALYLGNVGDYRSVQRDLPGLYRVIVPEGECLNGRFTDRFSVWDDAPKAEKAAAVRAVYYLLSQTAQNIYNVQENHGLPVNAASLERYLSVNGELSAIRETGRKIVFPAGTR